MRFDVLRVAVVAQLHVSAVTRHAVAEKRKRLCVRLRCRVGDMSGWDSASAEQKQTAGTLHKAPSCMSQ